ncbi:MAG: histidine--tRNA ligase [Rickettsiales bacterium]|nr:histidine--tRNA ligase [Rickettsiales bacterium]
MASKLQSVRGTHDWYGQDCKLFQHVVSTARHTTSLYGFEEMMTPIFEFSEVFHRTLGDTSDVVSKETYTFEDRGGESLTLRPECTASIARAFISNGLQDQLPCKFFYAGPAFRYERPQKGRMRQFHQIGAELLGAAEVQADIEVIAMAQQLFEALGLADAVSLELNTLGDAESRANYREALVSYFTQHKDQLSEDSQTRLEKNPLRILDSKAEQDKELVANAPIMQDYFNEASNAFFKDLTTSLDDLGIAYTHNTKLVRGLDYYNHTVFEFTTNMLGSQNAVLAGGRYDGLVEMMGGSDVPGIGWAAGVERLVALMQETNKADSVASAPIIALIPLGDAVQSHSLKIAQTLRNAGFVIEQGYRGNLSKRMKKADKMGATVALILGEDELEKHVIQLRDLKSGEQKDIAIDELEKHLDTYRSNA